MGMPTFAGSVSSYDNETQCSPDPRQSMPDPNNYTILKSKQVGEFLIVKIHYSDCTSFEGRKILIYEKISIRDLINQKHIDPHFSDNKNFYSPIARFIPTCAGWKMAQEFAKQTHPKKK